MISGDCSAVRATPRYPAHDAIGRRYGSRQMSQAIADQVPLVADLPKAFDHYASPMRTTNSCSSNATRQSWSTTTRAPSGLRPGRRLAGHLRRQQLCRHDGRDRLEGGVSRRQALDDASKLAERTGPHGEGSQTFRLDPLTHDLYKGIYSVKCHRLPYRRFLAVRPA